MLNIIFKRFPVIIFNLFSLQQLATKAWLMVSMVTYRQLILLGFKKRLVKYFGKVALVFPTVTKTTIIPQYYLNILSMVVLHQVHKCNSIKMKWKIINYNINNKTPSHLLPQIQNKQNTLSKTWCVANQDNDNGTKRNPKQNDQIRAIISIVFKTSSLLALRMAQGKLIQRG